MTKRSPSINRMDRSNPSSNKKIDEGDPALTASGVVLEPMGPSELFQEIVDGERDPKCVPARRWITSGE